MGLAAAADLAARRSNCRHCVAVSGFAIDDPRTRFQKRLSLLISFSSDSTFELSRFSWRLSEGGNAEAISPDDALIGGIPTARRLTSILC